VANLGEEKEGNSSGEASEEGSSAQLSDRPWKLTYYEKKFGILHPENHQDAIDEISKSYIQGK